MPPDQFFQSFTKGFYRITGSESTDNILDMLSAPGATNAANVQTSASDIGSGVSSATTNVATGSTQSGKANFENSVAGYILGVDSSDGLAKFYIGNSTNYLNWDGTNLILTGAISASAINIPDSVTTNSFHVDNMGNTWWGSTMLATAVASITNTGVATFTSIDANSAALTVQTVGDGGTTIQDASTQRSVSIESDPVNQLQKIKTLTCNKSGIYTFSSNVDTSGGSGGGLVLAFGLYQNAIKVQSVSRSGGAGGVAFNDLACSAGDVLDLYGAVNSPGFTIDSFKVQGQYGFGGVISGALYGFIPVLTTGTFPTPSAADFTKTLD